MLGLPDCRPVQAVPWHRTRLKRARREASDARPRAPTQRSTLVLCPLTHKLRSAQTIQCAGPYRPPNTSMSRVCGSLGARARATTGATTWRQSSVHPLWLRCPLCRPSRMHIGCRPSRIRYQSLKRALAATAEDRRVREPRQSLHSPVTHLPASIMDGEGRLVECSGQMTLQQRGRTPVTPAGHEAHMKPFCRSYASWKSFMKTEMPSSSLPGGRRKPMRVVDTGADGPS